MASLVRICESPNEWAKKGEILVLSKEGNMILHIGGDNVVFIRDIVAIIDKESMNTGRINCAFLNRMQNEKRLHGSSDDTVSYIITQENERDHMYCSSISCNTLLRRCGFLRSHTDSRLK